MKIKRDHADEYFSQYIRLRDRKCMRCYSPVQFNPKGLPISHTNSHYFGRAREGTRFETDNCICLCLGCHQHWGSADKEGYRNFMINWLGQSRFDTLTIQAATYCKKDRAMSLIIVKQLLASLPKP